MVKWCKGALNGDLSLAFRTSFGFALTFSQNISNLRFRFTHLMVHAPGSFQWHPLRAGALHTDHRVTAIIIVELDIVVVAKLSGECVGVRLKSDACLLHPLLEMWNLKGEWRCIYSDIFSSYNSILDKVWAVWAVPELLPLRGGTDTPLRGANLQLQTPTLLSAAALSPWPPAVSAAASAGSGSELLSLLFHLFRRLFFNLLHPLYWWYDSLNSNATLLALLANKQTNKVWA